MTSYALGDGTTEIHSVAIVGHIPKNIQRIQKVCTKEENEA